MAFNSSLTYPFSMANEALCDAPPKRRFQRISLPKGMFVAWYGGGDHQTSRVQTLGMGGVFIDSFNPPAVDTKLRLLKRLLK